MNKKKIVTILVASIITVTIIGGTLAFFTSSDSIVNKFSILNSDEGGKTHDSGIKINEKFDLVDASKMAPGRTVEKKVQILNTAKYDQFIRVKLTKQFVDEKGKVINEKDNKPLDTNLIQLNFTNNLKPNKEDKSELTPGSWYYNNQDQYYYYIGKVTEEKDNETGKFGGHTNILLDSVTLSKKAGNEYKNLNFQVVVDVDSIQAANDGYKDWAPANLYKTFENLQKEKVTIPTDEMLNKLR